MEVQIEEILAAQAVIDRFNKMNIKEVTFIENGQPVEIDPEVLEEHRFIGLNNRDFITMGIYKEKPGFTERKLSSSLDGFILEGVDESEEVEVEKK